VSATRSKFRLERAQKESTSPDRLLAKRAFGRDRPLATGRRAGTGFADPTPEESRDVRIEASLDQ
jgi:hypothetical protein